MRRADVDVDLGPLSLNLQETVVDKKQRLLEETEDETTEHCRHPPPPPTPAPRVFQGTPTKKPTGQLR